MCGSPLTCSARLLLQAKATFQIVNPRDQLLYAESEATDWMRKRTKPARGGVRVFGVQSF